MFTEAIHNGRVTRYEAEFNQNNRFTIKITSCQIYTCWHCHLIKEIRDGKTRVKSLKFETNL